MIVKKLKPTQQKIMVELEVPEEYIGREVILELICEDLPGEKEQRRKALDQIFSKNQIDMRGFKFNREELYTRDIS